LPLRRGDTLTGAYQQDSSSKTPSAPVASRRTTLTTSTHPCRP